MRRILVSPTYFYAHTKKNKNETLGEHSLLTKKYFNKLVKDKDLNQILFGIINKVSISEDAKKLLVKMIENVIYLHDIGKINPNYQYLVLGNNYFKNKTTESNYKNHSMLSALIYINHHLDKVRQSLVEDRNILLVFLILNSYIVSKHHGALDSLDDYIDKLCSLDGEGRRVYEQEREVLGDYYLEPFVLNYSLVRAITFKFKEVINEITDDMRITLFIYSRFMMSILLACDYYATSEFMTEKEVKLPDSVDNLKALQKQFNSTKISQKIREYQQAEYPQNISNEKDINILRTEIFLDAERVLKNNPDANIYYLEAPTGGGKSNTAFNLSFKLAEQNNLHKIIYVYPFNTLVEQNIETLRETFENEDIEKNISVINSMVPIKERFEEDSNDVDYNKSLLDRQFLHDPIVLTTHVSLFNYLFGTRKTDLFPLYQLANSVVVLDEIQSYKNMIWKEIIVMLNKYAELLNIKFIIMSATLPNLDKLVGEETGSIKLIQDRERYFNHPLFKNRVKVDYSLLAVKKENLIPETGCGLLASHVIKHVKGNTKILMEFIKKKTAKDFWEFLVKYKDELGLRDVVIELMTGDSNSAERKEIINLVKSEKTQPVILVATQVVEAGVDIDMDIGYKDISLLDSEEQFMGRINRSCLRAGTVFFFNYDNIGSIYRNDFRKMESLTLINESIQKKLVTKDFEGFYEKVLEKINEKGEENNQWSYREFIKKKIGSLNFKDVEAHMKLIDSRPELRVFLNRTIKKDNNTILHGKDIWSKFVALLKNSEISYPEKKVKMSKIWANMEYFIYTLPLNNNFIFNDIAGDIYYIENGEKYFINNKFMGKNVVDEDLFI